MKRYAWLPSFIREPLVLIRNNYRNSKRRQALKRLTSQKVRRIVVGCGSTQFEGWQHTDKEVLNLINEGDWDSYFEMDSLDAILAEHVWEHLTSQEAIVAATNCFRYLKPGGYLRVAVPDGLHPDPDYIAQVKPGGYGSGADDHKVLYTYQLLSAELDRVGYQIKLLEWFDEHGKFHQENWDAEDGMIIRSTRFDPHNKTNPTAYTSLIIDAFKP